MQDVIVSWYKGLKVKYKVVWNISTLKKTQILYKSFKIINGPNTTDFPVCKNRNLIRAVNSRRYQWKIRRGIYLGSISPSKVFHWFFRLYWVGESVSSLGGIVGCVPCVIVSRPDCPSSADASSSVYITTPPPIHPLPCTPLSLCLPLFNPLRHRHKT